ncbi:hypothetical protein [Hydrogenophaga sp.]|uniref:hypothetical protein n=1 Tax=Hydrogenophaga sp. TaxID=1904254 RepID=UPI003D0A760E
MSDANGALDAIEASLFATLGDRHVQRGLADPAAADRQHLLDGLVCVVGQGGGSFANYLGREGQLGLMTVMLVGFLLVEEDTEPVAIEQAELALLQELLDWTAHPNNPGLNSVLPLEFRQSQQLEHPYGWVALSLEVRI